MMIKYTIIELAADAEQSLRSDDDVSRVRELGADAVDNFGDWLNEHF